MSGVTYTSAPRPGPRPLPLVGNLCDFPTEKPWKIFAEWEKQYGDIVYVNVLGTRIVILNSLNRCNDLLDKRSAKYSGRPRMVMLAELAGFDYTFNLMSYTPRWRRYRRLFHQHFNERESLKYRTTQKRYVHHFLQRLLTTPENLFSHTRLLFGETILDTVYAIKKEDDNTKFIQLAEKAAAITLQAVIPGQFFVDALPLLKHLPSWFPGARFKRLASNWRQVADDLKDLPFSYTKKKLKEGSGDSSIVASMLEKCDEEQIQGEEGYEEVSKGCAAFAYLAGADTTLSTIQTFFMLMANYQDLQTAAQEELDSLLGTTPSRLPSYGDRDQLPFVVAITKELLRWHNVLPISAPHVLTEDDEYDGYLLRKGTIVFTNIWHILRNPEIYPHPHTFDPRRWLIDTLAGLSLNPDVPEPALTFGSGRRICPGRHFAANSLFITVANVLACFRIRPLDDQGRPAERINEVFTSGLLVYPAPFKVSITPRSNDIARLIKDLEA